MSMIVLKVPYGFAHWMNSIGAYWDKVNNRWYVDSSKPLSAKAKSWIVDEQPRIRQGSSVGRVTGP